MTYLLNYGYTLKALDAFVSDFNEQETAYKNKIRPAMVATMQQLLKIYGIALAKAYKKQPFTLEKLPPLRTNNVQIAKLTHASTRTVHRHIIRLQEAGIIINKQWHGSKAPYELWFTSKVLFLKLPDVVQNSISHRKTPAIKAVNKSVDIPTNEGQVSFKTTTDNQEIKNKKTTSCQDTDTSNTTSNINNRLIGVDKCITPMDKAYQLDKIFTGNTFKRTPLTLRPYLRTGHTRQQGIPLSLQPNLRAGNKTRTLTRNVQEKALSYNEVREKVVSRESMLAKQDVKVDQHTARESLLSTYVDKLWELAKDKLYAKIHLSLVQEDIAKTHLYKWYETIPTLRLDFVHAVYTKRIEMVRRYVAKAPDLRYVQLPYLFFDPENPNGFTRTKTWMQRQPEYQKRKRIKRKFFAVMNFFKHNELADSSNAIPRLQCFKQCETAIKALRQPEFLQEFYKASYHIVQSLS